MTTTYPPYRWLTLTQELDADRLWLSPVMAEAVALTAAAGRPSILVREQPRYVLLGPKDRRLPRITEAARELEREGIPVFMRIGGGSAVLLDHHCVSFAVARPCRDLTTLERNFREMAEGVILGLQALGLPAGFGAAAGSYCEGPYDLVVEGRKIAGVAQAIRRGFSLVSGMILVDQDPVSTTATIQRLYDMAGSTTRLRADAVTSLQALVHRPVSHQELFSCLEEGFRQAFGSLVPDPISEAEWDEAAALYPSRRFPPEETRTAS